MLVDVDRRRLTRRADDDDSATCRCPCGNRSGARVRGRSSAPPGSIGVTIATRLPESMKCGVEKTRFYPIPPAEALAATLFRVVPQLERAVRGFTAAARHARLDPPVAARRCTIAGRTPSTPPLLERDDRQPPAGDVEQLVLAAAGTSGFVGRPSASCPTANVSYSSTPSAASAATMRREQRPMQVVRHDDRVECFAGERPWSRLDVGDAHLDAGDAAQRRQRVGVAVDGDDVRAAGREQPRVPSAPCSDVEHARTARARDARSADPCGRAHVGDRASRAVASKVASLIACLARRPCAAGGSPHQRRRPAAAMLCARRFERRFVGEPAQEGRDVVALGDARCCQREVTARRIVLAREWRHQPAIAQMLGDHRQPAERDTLTADGGLHHLVVDAKAQRARGLQARLPVRREPAAPVEPRRAAFGIVEVQQHVVREIGRRAQRRCAVGHRRTRDRASSARRTGAPRAAGPPHRAGSGRRRRHHRGRDRRGDRPPTRRPRRPDAARETSRAAE